jgi:hypothetical protein
MLVLMMWISVVMVLAQSSSRQTWVGTSSWYGALVPPDNNDVARGVLGFQLNMSAKINRCELAGNSYCLKLSVLLI